MRHLIYYALFCLLLLLPGTTGRAQQTGPTVTPTQDEPQVTIRFPVNGQAVQGNVVILGDTAIEGFQNAELAFSYSDNPTDTWFLIQLSDQPVSSGALAEWDTSTITDGDYDLRLTVSRQGGEPLVSTINGLRVRNYTPIETSTPTPVTPTATPLPGDTPIPSQTPTPTITPVPPTATLLPTNPAEITRADVSRSLRNGALVAFGLFALLGIYFSIRLIRSGPE